MLNMKSETIPHDCSDCNHSCRQIGPIILVSVCILLTSYYTSFNTCKASKVEILTFVSMKPGYSQQSDCTVLKQVYLV